MERTLSKKHIKEAARMIAYQILRCTDSFALDESDLSEDTKELLIDEIHRIATTINGRRATNIGSTTEIINYVIDGK